MFFRVKIPHTRVSMILLYKDFHFLNKKRLADKRRTDFDKVLLTATSEGGHKTSQDIRTL